jgi:hypothetical protein
MSSAKRVFCRTFFCLAPLALSSLSLPLRGAGISPETYLNDVKYLASPELQGRATGTPELEKAGAFIASQFKSFGLKPLSGSSFELAFPAELGAHPGPDNTLAASASGERRTLAQGTDFVPFTFSTNGKFSGEVVFAGYGITAKEYNYDDYAGIDVKDKIVLILRHEPQENDDHSVFNGKKLTSYAEFVTKMVNAKMHGAKGVIWINDLSAHKNADKIEKFGASGGPRDGGVFFLQMTVAEAERWFASEGRDLKQTVAEIDKDLKPHSFAFGKVKVDLSVDLIRETKTVHNVAAYLPGKTDEYVIIGAHYDHLGLGDEHSLAPNARGTIHPGADDNASGTAGVIELARWFSKQPRPKRGIVFMTFAGEELGLLGSSWYVNHPSLPLEKAVAMINLDMIGRIREGRVFLSGIQTGTTLAKILEDTKVPDGLKLDQSGRNSGTNMNDASDHASFNAKQVPVLFFFSGLHADYHKPGDTADKIDAPDAAKLLDYVADFAGRLSAASDRPQFVKVARPSNPISAHGDAGDSGNVQSGYGPDFGSIPDFNEPPKGVRFADVREGSPAAKAGLRGGDIMVEFDGKEIGNLYDFTFTLRDHKPGDLVLVKVLRDGKIIEAKVLLTERR